MSASTSRVPTGWRLWQLDDPKRTVAAGYDRIGDAYTQDTALTRVDEREQYTQALFRLVPSGAHLLELGCGSGIPTTRRLAERYRVVGVDISAEQVNRARRNVPSASFHVADMTALHFEPGAFDAVAAFYSVIHVPRDQQPQLFAAIHAWLRPGGLLVATMGAGDDPAGVDDDWFGTPMYWSSFDADTNRKMVTATDFDLVSADLATADEDGQPVTFLWIVARKPTAP